MNMQVMQVYGLTETYGHISQCLWQEDWDGLPPEAQAERQAQQRARMFEGITLTPEQSAKIDTIQAATRTKRMEMMQGGGGGDRQAMMQQMMEMQNAEAKAIKALLTPEQAAIFDKNREAMMQRRGGGLR